MIRLAWRQFRVPLVAAAAALVALAAVVVATRPHLADVYDSTVRGCGARGNCDDARASFQGTYEGLRTWLTLVVAVVPGVVVAFWGAPLVAREVEQGTFRLAWTQSVTRSRWLAAQLAVGGAASVAFAGAASLLVTWWSTFHDRAVVDAFATFDQRDVVPLGYAAFAFALGVTVGLFVRRVMPAVATTVVVFIAVRFATTAWVRPAWLSPKVVTGALDDRRVGLGSHNGEPMNLLPEPPRLPNAWVRSVEVVDDAGSVLTPGRLHSLCPRLETTLGPPPSGSGERRGPAPAEVGDVIRDCVVTVGRRFEAVTTYHPADRYWTFQWLELGLYVGLAALLVAACFWGIRRVR